MNEVFYVKKLNIKLLTFIKQKIKDYCFKKLKTNLKDTVFVYLRDALDDNYTYIHVLPTIFLCNIQLHKIHVTYIKILSV